MPNCTLTLSGLARDCKDNAGGIKEVYIIDYNSINNVTVLANVITGITVDSEAKFHTYAFRKQTGTLTTTINSDEVAGTLNYSSELNMKFSKLETAKRLEVVSLAMGETAAIVRDSNDRFWYLGKDYPVTLSAGSIATGTNLADFAGYDVTLSDISTNAPFEVAKNAGLIAILDGNQMPITLV